MMEYKKKEEQNQYITLVIEITDISTATWLQYYAANMPTRTNTTRGFQIKHDIPKTREPKLSARKAEFIAISG